MPRSRQGRATLQRDSGLTILDELRSRVRGKLQ